GTIERIGKCLSSRQCIREPAYRSGNLRTHKAGRTVDGVIVSPQHDRGFHVRIIDTATTVRSSSIARPAQHINRCVAARATGLFGVHVAGMVSTLAEHMADNVEVPAECVCLHGIGLTRFCLRLPLLPSLGLVLEHSYKVMRSVHVVGDEAA